MPNKYFEFWDPMKGPPSWVPINSAQMIPISSRQILKNRTKEDLELMIAFVNDRVREYYKSDRSRVIEEISSDDNWHMAEINEDGQITDILDQGKEHYSLVDDSYPFVFTVEYALADCDLDIDYPVSTSSQPKEYELWAALSLSEYAQYIYNLEHEFNLTNLKHQKRTDKDYTSHEIVRFANQLLDSCQMLNIAIAMYTESKVEDKTKQQYKKTQDQIKIKRIEISKNANLVRHNKTNSLKQTILTEWEKNPQKFQTIKEAGDHFEEVMNLQGIKITSETIRGYVSEHAKTIGFTFPRQQKK